MAEAYREPGWWGSVTTIWPRRLLHIPSMTSLERHEGNTYGDQKEPRYSILTYTWGRWQTDQGSAIDIKGTTWKIPAVEEKHFTVNSFHSVIEKMGEDVEHAWVDVACIDQEDNPVKMDEVGRQVGIFKQAHRVFVWLNRLEPGELQHCLDEIFTNGPELGHEKDVSGVLGRLHSLTEAMGRLFNDPWFSSLWTLQESILRRDAMILSREAKPVPLCYMEGYAFLATLISACQNTHTELSRIQVKYKSNFWDPSIKHVAEKLQKMIEGVGCHFLYTSNPNVQYGAARFRKTSYELDRIYGIMQIYGLQLGESKRPHEKPTLEQLEDEFGEALMIHSPVLAQMFTHLNTPQREKTWRITQYSRVPEAVMVYLPPYNVNSSPHGMSPPRETPHCQFSTHASLRQVRIKGKSWAFGDLVKYWYHQWNIMDYPQQVKHSIMLDENDHVRERIPQRLAEFNLASDHQQHELGNALLAIFGEANLVWFLVGEKPGAWVRDTESGPVYTTWLLGLILLYRDEENWWERIGICSWDVSVGFWESEQPKSPCPKWDPFEGRLG
jgi:hypothetical protein